MDLDRVQLARRKDRSGEQGEASTTHIFSQSGHIRKQYALCGTSWSENKLATFLDLLA